MSVLAMNRKALTTAILVGFCLPYSFGLAFADAVDDAVDGLLKNDAGTTAYKNAIQAARNLTVQQQGELANKIKNRLANDAGELIKFSLNQYKIANSFGRNPFIKVFGDSVAAAVNAQTKLLVNTIKKDPCAKEFMTQFVTILSDQNGLHLTNERAQKVFVLYKKAFVARKRKERAKKLPKEKKGASNDSLHFVPNMNDPLQSTLTVMGQHRVTGIFDREAMTTNEQDNIVSADISMPTYFMANTPGPGEPVIFSKAANDDTPVQVGEFAKYDVPILVYENGKLSGLGGTLGLSGVNPDDPFFDSSLAGASDFINELHSNLLEDTFTYLPDFTIDIGEVNGNDFAELTNNFTTPAEAPITSSIAFAKLAIDRQVTIDMTAPIAGRITIQLDVDDAGSKVAIDVPGPPTTAARKATVISDKINNTTSFTATVVGNAVKIIDVPSGKSKILSDATGQFVAGTVESSVLPIVTGSLALPSSGTASGVNSDGLQSTLMIGFSVDPSATEPDADTSISLSPQPGQPACCREVSLLNEVGDFFSDSFMTSVEPFSYEVDGENFAEVFVDVNGSGFTKVFFGSDDVSLPFGGLIASVPEPTASSLSLISLLFVTLYRRRP